jgi:fatty-acyl-CoA synthase
MLGSMQSWSLTVDRIIDHAARYHGERQIVTRSVEGPITRSSYAAIRAHAKQLSHALKELGIGLGDRIATLAWNTDRHLETWYAVMGIGAVCHTLNPRLHPDQLCWIIRHADDRLILADLTFAPMLLEIFRRKPMPLQRIVLLSDEAHRPPQAGLDVLMYVDWLRGRPVDDAVGATPWGCFSEETPCGLCYTSGTTGNPKGVLYSHRSNFLHTFMTLQPDMMGLSATDTVLPIVPMYHANAWGLAFSAPAVGAKLVMPGAQLDGASIYELLENEQVTFSAAVPTVWQSLLQHLDATGARLSCLKRVVIGGSACPEVLIRRFKADFGVEVRHAWGMTETSPVGTLGAPDAELASLPFSAQLPWRVKQGRPPLGIELRLKDETGGRVREDDITCGRLMVKGPTVIDSYFGATNTSLDEDGFFDTEDIATIDSRGYLKITDRAKDVIKSGGEWISSIAIENIVLDHPKVANAAVVGVPDPKWDERPVLFIKLKPGVTLEEGEILDYLTGKIVRWWLPNELIIVHDLPLGPTGKIDKNALRLDLPSRLKSN